MDTGNDIYNYTSKNHVKMDFIALLLALLAMRCTLAQEDVTPLETNENTSLEEHGTGNYTEDGSGSYGDDGDGIFHWTSYFIIDGYQGETMSYYIR